MNLHEFLSKCLKKWHKFFRAFFVHMIMLNIAKLCQTLERATFYKWRPITPSPFDLRFEELTLIHADGRSCFDCGCAGGSLTIVQVLPCSILGCLDAGRLQIRCSRGSGRLDGKCGAILLSFHVDEVRVGIALCVLTTQLQFQYMNSY